MATIRSQMVLNDGISGVLMKMNRALNTTLNAFEQVQRASGRAVDATQIQAARAALVQANNEVEQMAEGYRRAAEQEEVLNRGLRNGNSAAGGLLGKVKGIVATLAAGAGLKALTGLSDKLTSTTAASVSWWMTAALWMLWSRKSWPPPRGPGLITWTRPLLSPAWL